MNLRERRVIAAEPAITFGRLGIEATQFRLNPSRTLTLLCLVLNHDDLALCLI